MIQFQVQDMTCGHCVATITKAVSAVDAAAKVVCDVATHRVSVETTLAATQIEHAMREAGYTPQRVD